MAKNIPEDQNKGRQGVNWQELYAHLSKASERLDETDELTEEELERIWARRAASIAEKIDDTDLGDMMELVIVLIERELYGVDVQYVRDLRPVQSITRVPRVPDWVAGVVNLRGRIMSVLDLSRYLSLPQHDDLLDADEQRLMVVETPQMELAILVDQVLSVETVPISAIEEATSTVRGIRAEHVRGLVIRKTNSESGMVIILDLPALLADRVLVVHEEV